MSDVKMTNSVSEHLCITITLTMVNKRLGNRQRMAEIIHFTSQMSNTVSSLCCDKQTLSDEVIITTPIDELTY